MGASAQARKMADGRGGTHVPFTDVTERDRPWDIMGEPVDDSGEGTKHFGITVSDSESDFLEWLGAFRNAMAKARGKKLRRQWTRKTAAESLLSGKISTERDEFREMFEDLGPPPSPKDDDAMLRYAKRVLDWSEKRDRKK